MMLLRGKMKYLVIIEGTFMLISYLEFRNKREFSD